KVQMNVPNPNLSLHPKMIILTVWWSIPELIHYSFLKLHQLGMEVLSHPPYSPDLSPTDFQFFRSLGNFLTQKRFRKQKVTENAFQQFFLLQRLGFLFPRN
ncbi:Histone-lysine N-methyltransferase SETMAR, partial [Habropoda laboriosa]